MAVNYTTFNDEDLKLEVARLTQQLNQYNTTIQNLSKNEWYGDLSKTLEVIYTTQRHCKELEAAVFNMVGRRK
jgi:cell division protein FtsB